MRAISFLLIGLLSLLPGACSSVRTHFDYDPNEDFSSWRSYAWYPGEAVPSGSLTLDNPLLHERVESAVDRVLAARGYTRLQDGDPDFLVKFHLSTEQKLDVVTMNRGYSSGPYRGRWGGVGWTETSIDQYNEGTLVIDFVDAATGRLVWRGSGTRRLSRNPPPDQVTKRVNEAVDEILSQFPPSP